MRKKQALLLRNKAKLIIPPRFSPTHVLLKRIVQENAVANETDHVVIAQPVKTVHRAVIVQRVKNALPAKIVHLVVTDLHAKSVPPVEIAQPVAVIAVSVVRSVKAWKKKGHRDRISPRKLLRHRLLCPKVRFLRLFKSWV